MLRDWNVPVLNQPGEQSVARLRAVLCPLLREPQLVAVVVLGERRALIEPPLQHLRRASLE